MGVLNASGFGLFASAFVALTIGCSSTEAVETGTFDEELVGRAPTDVDPGSLAILPQTCFGFASGHDPKNPQCLSTEQWKEIAAKNCAAGRAQLADYSVSDSCGRNQFLSVSAKCCSTIPPNDPGPKVCYTGSLKGGPLFYGAWKSAAAGACSATRSRLQSFDVIYGGKRDQDVGQPIGATFECCSGRSGNEIPPTEPEPQPPKPDAGPGRAECVPAGCSRELCVPAGTQVMSPCNFLPAFACYQKNPSACQAVGSTAGVPGSVACGWNMHDGALAKCLATTP